MKKRDSKRMHKVNSTNLTPPAGTNALISSCHDYANVLPTVSVMPEDEFSSLPVTPSKSPAAKKALYGIESGPARDNVIINTLSKLTNERADSIEMLVSANSKKIDENSLKIEGLKKTLDFACNEIKDTQNAVANVKSRLKNEEIKVIDLLTRVSDLETYSRRRNLKIYGMAEDKDENVREKVLEVCRAIIPNSKIKPDEAIDVVHCLGKSLQNKSNKNPAAKPVKPRPRGIIIRFALRCYRNAL